MAVKIRLKRVGQKKQALYRIVVADSRSPRDGRFIEEIGTYNPNTDPSEFKVDAEAAKKWLNTGAQPTIVVAKILKAAGVEK
jgi:small subunit ribosomal protein S16